MNEDVYDCEFNKENSPCQFVTEICNNPSIFEKCKTRIRLINIKRKMAADKTLKHVPWDEYWE